MGQPLKQNLNLPGFAPQTSESEIIISRDQYVISYNKEKRAPNWAAWELDPSRLGNSGRSQNFSQDSQLESYLNQNDHQYQAVTPEEYKGSCFDRGHQVPSADRTRNSSDNQMTFMMSNMIPQTPYLNRVIWVHLETYTRELVTRENKKVFVVAGPIYDQDIGSIGPKRDIPIPSKNFKLIFMLDQNQTARDIDAKTPVIAAIFPNVNRDGSPISDLRKCPPMNAQAGNDDVNDWKKYQTSVAEIERESGLKFFDGGLN